MLTTTPRDHLVAGTGFEPGDLRVMSPTSYRAAPPRDNIIHIVYMVEDDGIEPPTPACKAGALPAELILQKW